MTATKNKFTPRQIEQLYEICQNTILNSQFSEEIKLEAFWIEDDMGVELHFKNRLVDITIMDDGAEEPFYEIGIVEYTKDLLRGWEEVDSRPITDPQGAVDIALEALTLKGEFS